MLLTNLLGALAVVSFALVAWQVIAGLQFPLHRRKPVAPVLPPVTVLKPLKGRDAETGACLESWFAFEYRGPVQLLFGVAAADDPVCEIVGGLLGAYPEADAQLVICSKTLGPNAKVSTLAQLETLAKHELVVISDADVRAPADLLAQIVTQLQEPGVGLVNCFYRLANPANLPMRLEAVAVNADFWSQVLQAKSLKPLDFALGAVMATTRTTVAKVGGFAALADFLADDYQLGNRIARGGAQIALSPVVVDCRSAPMNWRDVWTHQIRWARTIRACQPAPYFLSILNNVTLWPLLFAVFGGTPPVHISLPHLAGVSGPSGTVLDLSCGIVFLLVCLFMRVTTASLLEKRLTGRGDHIRYAWLVPVYDVLRVFVWALAFLGNEVTWRGMRFQVTRGGKLRPL